MVFTILKKKITLIFLSWATLWQNRETFWWKNYIPGIFNKKVYLENVFRHIILLCMVICFAVWCGITRGVAGMVLYCIVLYCTILYCMALYGIVLYGTVWYDIVLYGTVWYCIALHCIVWHGMALYCMVLYATVWYDIVWYCMILYGMVWYGMVLFLSWETLWHLLYKLKYWSTYPEHNNGQYNQNHMYNVHSSGYTYCCSCIYTNVNTTFRTSRRDRLKKKQGEINFCY